MPDAAIRCTTVQTVVSGSGGLISAEPAPVKLALRFGQALSARSRSERHQIACPTAVTANGPFQSNSSFARR